VSGLDQILRNARAERCQLRHFWELGDHLSGREQAKLAHGLARIVPTTVDQEDGPRRRCEPPFELRPKDRRRLVLAMLVDGASRSEILSSVSGLSGGPSATSHLSPQLSPARDIPNHPPQTAFQSGVFGKNGPTRYPAPTETFNA
jgi:hypothetical protein